jgi:periplasmic protein TonB
MQATYILQRGTRMGLSVSLGAVVTVFLIILMCSLIAMDPPDIIESTPIKPSAIMDRPEPIEVRPKEALVRPEDAEREPSAPEMQVSYDNTNDLTRANVIAPPIFDEHNGVQAPDTGSATALFMVAPRYPNRAIQRGIEGYVDLLFDITPTGKTENIRVLHAEPKGYFESSSIKTLKKWKYKPAMDDGVAIAQKNKMTRIKFELDK